MNALVTASGNRFTDTQLQIIRRTVAKDCNADEFDLFIERCKLMGLNPLNRECFASVYSKDDPAKRNMVVIIEIAGLRKIAARSRDYRPDHDEPVFTYDAALKSPSNPKGIEKCTVRSYKLGPDRQWYAVPGTAYWDEFVKLERSFEWGQRKGERIYHKDADGNAIMVPEGNWGKMPRRMIETRAESHSLRKGWPETLACAYAEGEEAEGVVVEATFEDVTASDQVEAANAERRREVVGASKDEFPFQFEMGGAVEMVPAGQVHARIEAFAMATDTVMDLLGFEETNAQALNRFWADHKADALDVRDMLQKRRKDIEAAADAEEQESGKGDTSPADDGQQQGAQGELIS